MDLTQPPNPLQGLPKGREGDHPQANNLQHGFDALLDAHPPSLADIYQYARSLGFLRLAKVGQPEIIGQQVILNLQLLRYSQQPHQKPW